jgi:hypothetical protein
MGDLAPVAFDIETSGLDEDAVITVAGFSHDLVNWLAPNTDGQHADAAALTEALNQCTDRQTELVVTPDEAALLRALDSFVNDRIDGDAHYLTAYTAKRGTRGLTCRFYGRAVSATTSRGRSATSPTRIRWKGRV